jgi:hypothetical protein
VAGPSLEEGLAPVLNWGEIYRLGWVGGSNNVGLGCFHWGSVWDSGFLGEPKIVGVNILDLLSYSALLMAVAGAF